jgi:hypothetical protein
MTCDVARDALLDADLPIDDASDLARHVRECGACARIANAMARDLTLLRVAVRRRARRRTRRVTIATTVAIAAASVVVSFIHEMRRVGEPRPAVNAAREGIVSIEVPADKMATVLQTTDPNVTIVWLTDAPRRGS